MDAVNAKKCRFNQCFGMSQWFRIFRSSLKDIPENVEVCPKSFCIARNVEDHLFKV
jgi:hypothetical protein